ncbi:histone deacetylase family protein [Pelomonas sp. CA6]|uniref:histone deacetylase family protein n=1 Tax=Pelomonas sp. CA6 TaxID=2907999 RepID=UPI001F4AD2BD|nr:histone deacetylase family protein [Pelomonas sp. CA6]MCH7342307.1 histone deacetylase family protein [Pelomonas sp. CA6]
MSTAYLSHPACRRHDMGPGHPECPQRLDAIEDWLIVHGMDAALTRVDATEVDLRTVELAHTHGYVAELADLLQSLASTGESRAVDPDTVAMPHTWAAALRSAGAAVQATDLVLDRKASNAFCAVRPPGHHATRDQSMGFCFFNNVAIAARHALDNRGLRRVAVVDFDVHHGNGTEDILAGDDRVLMVSIFQDPLFPYSGAVPKGTNMVNIPVPPYTRGMDIREMCEAQWFPALEEFRPEMIFISAGFDGHREDDMGQLGLTEADYEWFTLRIMDVAQRHARGRVVSVLEGGYHLGALARSVGAHLRALAGV